MREDDRRNTAETVAKEVLRVRFGQLDINERLKNKEFRIPVHLALGHEAIAVAVALAMTPDDTLCLPHRNIHYNLARATDLGPELAELRLENGGLAGGTLGSMNMANPGRGIVYTSSILGNDLCVSAGVALAGRLAGGARVGFVVTGDGAMEEGSFSEAMLFCKSFSLPTVFVVENNGWSLATRIEERRAPIDVAALAAAYGAAYLKLEGNDACAYAEKVAALRDRVLADGGPAVIEVMLTTLGSWTQPTPEFPQGKFINYHNGAARTVSPDPWPVICEDATDPVHVLETRFALDRLHGIAGALHRKLFRDLP